MAILCSDFSTRCNCPVEIAPFTSGEAFLAAFESGSYSIVFMDIYLDGMDGIKAALKMRELDSRCILVFLTASMDFMPDAFTCHAFEYITKPVSPQRVLNVLTDAFKVLPQQQTYIEVAVGRKTAQVSLDSIAAAATDAHYLNMFLSDGETLRCRMTMTQFLEKIGNDGRFILINKGISINADHFLKFEGHCCIMENGLRFPIRVRDCRKTEQAVWDYHFRKIRNSQRPARRY